MKDEIKEILNITDTADYKRLSVDEIIVLKDYIINLQKENKQTKLLKELYKLRNEKAINDMQNYIDKQYRDTSDIDISIVNFWIDLLQGSDKNE